eukprot:9072327-Pyramimonas_sp.AAC.1
MLARGSNGLDHRPSCGTPRSRVSGEWYQWQSGLKYRQRCTSGRVASREALAGTGGPSPVPTDWGCDQSPGVVHRQNAGAH